MATEKLINLITTKMTLNHQNTTTMQFKTQKKMCRGLLHLFPFYLKVFSEMGLRIKLLAYFLVKIKLKQGITFVVFSLI